MKKLPRLSNLPNHLSLLSSPLYRELPPPGLVLVAPAGVVAVGVVVAEAVDVGREGEVGEAGHGRGVVAPVGVLEIGQIISLVE